MATRGNVVPLVREVPADLLTPVAAYLKLAAREPHAFLLESVEGGEKLGRYSFLGLRPTRVLRARGRSLREWAPGGPEEVTEGKTAWDRLREWMRPLHPVRAPGLPRFTGGAVGFVSYDAVRWSEAIAETVDDDLELPDLEFGLYDTVVAFDHLRHRMLLITSLFTEEGDLEPAHRRAVARLDDLERRLAGPLPDGPRHATAARTGEVSSNVTRDEFVRRVARVQEEIRAGEVFQVVLSQRFELSFPGDPFGAYRALRRINPSPYMFYVRSGDLALAGSSPEMLVRVEGEEVRARPIAGTRRRGSDDDEDARLEAELLADPKERAEHVMLLDLARNDLGRVCRPGTVRVEESLVIERYSHVMHLVSGIRGRLAEGRDALDALTACFPAGTVTGAPKVRAMQIIDELEGTRRGPYAGAVGYLDFGGNLDTCITIRTLALTGGKAYAQAGAGVVADSVPEREHRETEEKAGALLEAARLAEEWFR